MTDTGRADRAIPDIWQELSQQISFDRGPLTSAQQSYLPHALNAITKGLPDVLFAHTAEGDVLYTLYWIQGLTFGVLNAVASEQEYPGVPITEGWVRPVSEVSRVDLRVVVEPDRMLSSEVAIYYDATLNWQDGQTPVRLDGTFSGNHRARNAANALILAVLNHVGTEPDERGVTEGEAGS
jgi:hypothetical protein